jgi:methionyl aminopeptidase
MWDGIAALASGAGLADRLGVVGEAVEQAVEAAAADGGPQLGIVQDYVGHGIGSAMHQPPDVLNYRTRERGIRLKPGMCLAIEPMITRGDPATDVLDDDWTVVTGDGSRAAHWEHSVALHEGGIWVLTAVDGGAAELAARGVAVAPLA